MYRPAVSVKKQLELEHVKASLRHQALRKSAKNLHGRELSSAGGDEVKKGVNYDRPWRGAMARRHDSNGSRNLDIFNNTPYNDKNEIKSNSGPNVDKIDLSRQIESRGVTSDGSPTTQRF